MRSLVGRRRRIEDDGEDDVGPIIVTDSQSEGSVLSEVDDEQDGSSFADTRAGAEDGRSEGRSEEQERASPMSGGHAAVKNARKARKKKAKQSAEPVGGMDEGEAEKPAFGQSADTAAMMNGLRIDDGATGEAVEFESMAQATATEAPAVIAPTPANGHAETLGQRQRRDHEEYRRKRDADPAFVPNRGNFFMHDTRGQQNGQGPQNMRGAFTGRGRGRGGMVVGGPFSPANQLAQAELSAEQPWKHDLHETINEQPHLSQQQEDSARLFPRPAQPQAPPVLSFSNTTLVGKVQIRVLLPGMKAPVICSEVPWKHYVRLPNHRPPLRRDKPVRVSLPDTPPHYIFPSTDRSFVFIPRQQRPTHRGSYQRSIGGGAPSYGPGSRRTSVFGGSVYASSIAASRRSSMAGISRADAFSPSAFTGAGMPPPIVRLPYGGHPNYSGFNTPQQPRSGHHTPTGPGLLQIHTYPLPQQPMHQGTPTSTMHQPRPQKAISVTGIESPAALALQQVPSNDTVGASQPFEGQLPLQSGMGYQQQQPPYFYPQQAGTPLSGIPEQGWQAPMPYAPQPPPPPPFYPPQHAYGLPQPQQYYYSPPEAYGPSQAQPGIYMPALPPPPQYPQFASAMPPPPPPPQPAPPEHSQHPQQPQHTPAASTGASGMLAHESNGMVFYVPRSEAESHAGASQPQFQPAESFVPSYAMPGLMHMGVGMGMGVGMPPTPAPDGSSGAPWYYGDQGSMGQQGGMWYPPPGQQGQQ